MLRPEARAGSNAPAASSYAALRARPGRRERQDLDRRLRAEVPAARRPLPPHLPPRTREAVRHAGRPRPAPSPRHRARPAALAAGAALLFVATLAALRAPTPSPAVAPSDVAGPAAWPPVIEVDGARLEAAVALRGARLDGALESALVEEARRAVADTAALVLARLPGRPVRVRRTAPPAPASGR